MPQPDLTSGRFSRWPWWRRWFGQRSERAAASLLRKLGYRILGRNLSDRRGEIDIIAIDGSTVVIVEVRSTAGTDLQRIAASVDAQKQRRLTQAALRFFHRRRLHNIPIRFDVLVVSWPPTQRRPTIQHFPNAFESVGRFQMHS